jgi:hypothetical protein
MKDFRELLKDLLISENGYTEAEANDLINSSDPEIIAIIMKGIWEGPFCLRAVAMALEIKRTQKKL